MNLNKKNKYAIRKAYNRYTDLMDGWQLLPRHVKEFDLKSICRSLNIEDYHNQLCAYFIK